MAKSRIMTRPPKTIRLMVLLTALVVPVSAGLSLAASWRGPQWLFRAFWVDRELVDDQWALHFNVPAAASALFLLGAGLTWCVVAQRRLVGQPTWPTVFGVFVIFMGVDEALMLHERLEQFLNVDWQLLYLPLMAFGGLAWLALMLRLQGDLKPARLALALGALLWVISQVLEFIQWDGAVARPGYRAYVVAEETLESWGSIAFLLAGVLVILRRPDRHHL